MSRNSQYDESEELRKKNQQLEDNLRESQFLIDVLLRNQSNVSPINSTFEMKNDHSFNSIESEKEELQSELFYYEQKLSVISSELEEIKRSKAWKLAFKLRRIREVIFPRNSIRERFAKVVYRILSNPKKFIDNYYSYRRNFIIIKSSDLFDEKWYLSRNPDVAQSKINPIKHFLLYGGFEGRDPGPNFSSNWYLENNEDVKNAGINPLIHFLKFGKIECRKPFEVSKPPIQQQLVDQNPEVGKYTEIKADKNPDIPSVIPNIRLFAVIGTWMEEDIIEATVQNALTQGCERVYLVDNDSTDETVNIAVKNGAMLAKSFLSKQYDETERLYYMNSVMREVSEQEEDEHLWWLFIDADEFPHGPSGLTLLSYLKSLDDRFRVVGSRFFNHYPHVEPAYIIGRHPIDFQPLCEEISVPMCSQGHRKHQLLRYDKNSFNIEAGIGFHCIISTQPVFEPYRPIFCHHFPFREKDITYQRLSRLWKKSENGESRADPHSFVTTHMLARMQSFDAVYNQDWDSVINFLNLDPMVKSMNNKSSQNGVKLVPWNQIVSSENQSILRWY